MSDIPILETNERRELVGSLEHALCAARKAGDDPYQWRWLIIALDAAFQNAMVAALEQGNGFLTMTKKDMREALAAHDDGAPKWVDHLDELKKLLNKVRGRVMRGFVDSQPLAPSSDQEAAIQKLHDLRNEFSHFRPKSWCLLLAGLPTVARHVVGAIRFLCWDAGTLLWHEEEFQERTRNALDELDGCLGNLELAYADEPGGDREPGS